MALHSVVVIYMYIYMSAYIYTHELSKDGFDIYIYTYIFTFFLHSAKVACTVMHDGTEFLYLTGTMMVLLSLK